jgi:hypothetical protein
MGTHAPIIAPEPNDVQVRRLNSFPELQLAGSRRNML